MTTPRSLPVAIVDSRQLRLTIPAAASAPGIAGSWPAGLYTLWLEMAKPGSPAWTTLDTPLYFALAPAITVSPVTVQPPVTTFEVTIDAMPQVDARQQVAVLFGDRPVLPKVPAAPADADAPTIVKADLPGTTVGVHRVRLSVDGIESIAAVRTGDVLEFDAALSVEVKP